MDKWINVKDELPARNEEVLCYSDKNGGYLFIGYLGLHSGEWCQNGFMHCYNVTHWMPLPKAPTK